MVPEDLEQHLRGVRYPIFTSFFFKALDGAFISTSPLRSYSPRPDPFQTSQPCLASNLSLRIWIVSYIVVPFNMRVPIVPVLPVLLEWQAIDVAMGAMDSTSHRRLPVRSVDGDWGLALKVKVPKDKGAKEASSDDIADGCKSSSVSDAVPSLP